MDELFKNEASEYFRDDVHGEKRRFAKKMILMVFKDSEVSLAEAKGLFHEIIKDMEFFNPTHL